MSTRDGRTTILSRADARRTLIEIKRVFNGV
jgi:hypothetical protein